MNMSILHRWVQACILPYPSGWRNTRKLNLQCKFVWRRPPKELIFFISRNSFWFSHLRGTRNASCLNASLQCYSWACHTFKWQPHPKCHTNKYVQMPHYQSFVTSLHFRSSHVWGVDLETQLSRQRLQRWNQTRISKQLLNNMLS